MSKLQETITFYYKKLVAVVDKALDSLIAVIDSGLNNIVKTVEAILSKVPATIETVFNTAVANLNIETAAVAGILYLIIKNSALIITNPLYSAPLLLALVLILKK